MVTSGSSPLTRVGIYGGAFDPPHLGHLVVACEARWQLGLDEVRLIPVGVPAHREPPRAAGETRLAMVATMVESSRGLVASRVELDRPGPSYTVDTLEQLTVAEPHVEWTLLIGADQVAAFHRWRRPERIIELARLGVVARDGTDNEALAAMVAELAPGRAQVVVMPQIGISSTMIRERIAAERPFSHLVAPGVASIITAGSLYGSPTQLP